MLQEDDPDGYPENSGFECPKCHQSFSRKSSLDRHLSYRCSMPAETTFPPPRRAPQVPPEKVKVDKEVDGLLASINCQYVKWRLAQKLGVTNLSTFPILFNYRFKGSKTSELSSLCPTRNSYEVLCSILIDARANHEVNQIAISKAIVIEKQDGSEVDVSQWLKPLNDREERSNRPNINVEETETHLLFSLAAVQQEIFVMEE